ncbi:MAG: hypothetical protein ACXAEU_22925 [Candidatus Hodarchaeales archaeon]|jgi:hypothetical protein
MTKEKERKLGWMCTISNESLSNYSEKKGNKGKNMTKEKELIIFTSSGSSYIGEVYFGPTWNEHIDYFLGDSRVNNVLAVNSVQVATPQGKPAIAPIMSTVNFCHLEPVRKWVGIIENYFRINDQSERTKKLIEESYYRHLDALEEKALQADSLIQTAPASALSHIDKISHVEEKLKKGIV